MNKKVSQEEQITVQSYDQNAAAWARGHSREDFWIKERALFHKYLLSGKVLEVGSGGGRDAEKLVSLGYEYIGTDVSKGLLEIAQARNPRTTFLQQSIYDLDFPDNNFDGFWASAVLLHIPKNRIDEALQNIMRVVTVGGIGFISMKQGEGERLIEEDRGEEGTMKRLFTFYSQDQFNAILKRNNLEILYSDILPPNGKTIWLTYLVRSTK